MRLTKEQFLEKAKNVHGDKYDYSKVEYVNNHTKICIICPEHGEFWQTPHAHIDAKRGCPKCGVIKCANATRKTKEKFINEAKKIHGNKYDYSKTEYNGCKTKVCIICPEHGEFWQEPNNHLNGSGCPKCHFKKIGDLKRMDVNDFIEMSKNVHGDKYDYSKVEYINNNTKVCIICPEHGEFWQTPGSHLYQKSECPKCSEQYMDREYFIECASKIHNNEYDYSKVEYINNRTKVCIICPEHGEFWQTPHHHLHGFGCSKCSGNKKLTTEEFIEKAQNIHGDKYDYSKVEYVNNHTKICIICPEHGEFWQTPNSHLNGRGCPKCKIPLLEKKVEKILKNNRINYIHQYHNCEQFGLQSLDFYLPDYNIGIECQGEQHFRPVRYRSEKMMNNETPEERFLYNKRRDEEKKKKCKNANIRLLYFLCKSFSKYLSENDEFAVNEEGLLKLIHG